MAVADDPAGRPHPFSDEDVIFQREVSSRLAARGPLIEDVLDKLREAGCALDPYFARLTLDEAITNAMLHGNGLDPARKVAVKAYCSRERWGVEVADEGPGYDWEAARQRALAGVDLEGSSGRGLALILSTGADVRFLDRGRRLLITHERGAPGESLAPPGPP